MKKLLWTLLLLVSVSAFSATSAEAVDHDYVKVGLRYADSEMFAANLENAEGEGYQFGWYDQYREFQPIGSTNETTITMIAAGDIYMSAGGEYSSHMPSGSHRYLGGWHAELGGYRTYEDAYDDAKRYGGWPAYIYGAYVVRVGSYSSKQEAELEASRIGGTVASSSNTGVLVSVTRTDRVIFEFDDGGSTAFGVQPMGWKGEGPITWFKGYRYKGGFEYPRTQGGNLGVINVVELEDYVKGVVPHEMSGNWPLAALEAQAVCARTFVKSCTKHTSQHFDVCSGTHCQVYHGINTATGTSDQAVENTAGECLYYNGDLVRDPVYHSSDGGATEDAENVWGGKAPYLRGKKDPYEAQTNIPDYAWSVTYTASELTWILEQKGENIGQVQNVYVSKYTPTGNVGEVTFEGSRGTLKVSGDRCRTIFYSSTYNKSVRSLRFEINGGSGGSSVEEGIFVNNSHNSLGTLEGISVLSNTGTVHTLQTNHVSAITSMGTEAVSGGKIMRTPSKHDGSGFTITGTGNGHNVGMSQYGAKAMAEQGYTYRDILEFYYTDITIR